MLAISGIFISLMACLITFFVTQSWSWKITNILHLWGMVRPIKCHQYYYEVSIETYVKETYHIKKNILVFHMLSCMCYHEFECVFAIAGL